MLDAVIAHARRDHPDECCGIVAGSGGVATRVVPIRNAERSPTGFVFDPAEQLQVWRSLDDADEDLLVVYHSHTMTEAYPSRTDVRWSANTPGTSWLLVSTRSEDAEIRSFRIEDGVVVEEELVVTDV